MLYNIKIDLIIDTKIVKTSEGPNHYILRHKEDIWEQFEDSWELCRKSTYLKEKSRLDKEEEENKLFIERNNSFKDKIEKKLQAEYRNT